MQKYYNLLSGENNLKQKTGAYIKVPQNFYSFCSIILSQCSFLQNLIQQIVYTSHGEQLSYAKETLRKFPNPKARIDFLCTFPYDTHDEIVDKVFDYSRKLFQDIYELRNILAHEVWTSSDNHQGLILFSTLDENSNVFMASGKLWYKEETTPQDIYDATIRFIEKIKVVSCTNLELAIKDAELCGWCLMSIKNILDEPDLIRKAKARESFLVFHGTSHLFDDIRTSSKTVEFSASRGKTITG